MSKDKEDASEQSQGFRTGWYFVAMAAISLFTGPLSGFIVGLISCGVIASFKKRLAQAMIEVDETSLSRKELARVSKVQEEIKAIRAENRRLSTENARLLRNVSQIEEADAILSDAKAKFDYTKKRAEDIVSETKRRYEVLTHDIKLAKQEIAALRRAAESYAGVEIVPAVSIADEMAASLSIPGLSPRLKEVRREIKALRRSDDLFLHSPADERERRVILVLADTFDLRFEQVASRRSNLDYGRMSAMVADVYADVGRVAVFLGNARLSEKYLNLRLQELKILVAVEEFRRAANEEQAAIRTAIREEAKLQAEADRAMRAAEREAAVVREALAQAEKRHLEIGAQDRLRHDEEMERLRAQLAEIEAKGQRALSMAQQTRSGYVYVISNIGSFGEGVFKIGMTRRLDPLDRVHELGDASVPFEFDVHAIIRSEDAPALEKSLHRVFAANQINKVNPRKEFFRIPINDIQVEIERMGIQCEWTMAAVAGQYRESLAIAERIRTDPVFERKWVEEDAKRLDIDMTGALTEDQLLEVV